MQRKVVPAILSADWDDIVEKIETIAAVSNEVQLDMIDGKYASQVTWPFSNPVLCEQIQREEIALPHWHDIDYELDLMVHNAHTNIDFFLRLSPARILFHLRAEDGLLNWLQDEATSIRSSCALGLAVPSVTTPDAITEYIPYVDFIQCMGIAAVGFQNQPFDARCLDTIKALKEQYPSIPIQVDGSVNEVTITKLAAAGADRFVVGSAVWTGDPQENVARLNNLIQ